MLVMLLLPNPEQFLSMNNSRSLVPAPRVMATVHEVRGLGTPTWLQDNAGRTWVNPLPMNTYVVFELPQPISRILFQWMASGNYNHNTIQYGGPSSYDLEYSMDSTNGTDGSWMSAANVSGNQVSSRSHVIQGENIKWIRFRVTGGGSSIDEIDIHDLSAAASSGAADTWGFIGDSITAFAFWRDAAAGKAFNTIVHETDASRYPSMMNLGIGGQNARHIRDRIKQSIEMNPGIHFWAIGIGTNGNDSSSQFEGYMREIIQIVLDSGKVPILARIPYSLDSGVNAHVQQYNRVIDSLKIEYGLIAGPDLYNAFKENSDSYFRDRLHPNNTGIEAINRLWAQIALDIQEIAQGDVSSVFSGTAQRDGSTVSSQENDTLQPRGVQEYPIPHNSSSFTVIGSQIIAPDGSVFLVKGININGPGWCFQRDTLQDVELLINVWQFNSVRLCAANKWDWFASNWNSDLDAIVNAFTEKGIVVILENHDYTGTYPSQNEDGGYDNEGNYLFPLSHLKSWWYDKAERFKDNPYVWFNIMNEPGSSASQTSASLWYQIHDEIIGLIREAGAENIIVLDEHAWGQGGGYYGGATSFDSAVITMGPALNDKYSNLVFSLHVYDAWVDGISRFDRYFHDASERGLCIILGEYGVMRNSSSQENAVRNMFNSAIPNGIGRMYWAWDDEKLPMTTGGAGWRVDRTDGTMPTNFTWVGWLIWLDNRGVLDAPIG